MSRITTLLLVFCLILSGCGKHKSRNNQVTSEPDSLSGPHSHAQELFDKARELQKGEDYPAAISVYQQLISLEPTDDDIKSVATLMDEGFLQLVYCYIFGGQRKDGADYFSHIYKENKLWFVRNYPRSVEISTAYSLYEATRLEEAVALIDRALSRQEEGRENEQLYVDNGIASVIYNQAGEIRKAIARGERSLEIIKTLEDQSKIVFVLGNLSVLTYRLLGDVLAEVGETALSIEAYQTCCDYIEKNQLVNQQRLVYYALGKLYAETMRPAESSRYLLMAHQANQQFTERRNAGLI